MSTAEADPQDSIARVAAAAGVLRRRWQYRPLVAMVLGSGLGDLASSIASDGAVEYGEIPHFPRCSAAGHSGILRFGLCQGLPTVVLQGRWHAYEGHSASTLALPVRALWMWGARYLITTCAGGGLNPLYRPGDLVVLRDHIGLPHAFGSPLRGPQPSEFGPGWPDMSAPYDARLRAAALQAARRNALPVHEGVYASVLGPNYETRAECRMLRRLGADVVGMSVVPEVIAAAPLKMRVFGLAVVTNQARPDAPSAVTCQEVLDTARQSLPAVQTLLYNLLDTLDDDE